MGKLGKILFLAAFALGLSTVTVSSAFAVNPCTPRPGCSCNFLNAAENHSNAVRVRDKGYFRQMVKQPDNTAGMTCFDVSMQRSAMLGQIFSDTPAGTFFPPANLEAWDASGVIPNQVYDETAGVGNNPATGQPKMLNAQYGVVMGNELEQHALNFADSLSAWLGATLLSYASSFMSSLNTAFAAITGFMTSITTQINTLASWVQQIQNWLDLLGGALPAAVPALVASIQAAWSTISGAVTGAINSFQNLIAGVLTNIVNTIQNFIANLIGPLFNSPAQGSCSRITRLWDGGIQPLGVAPVIGTILGAMPPFPPSMNAILSSIPIADILFRAIEGGGIEQGAPYFDFAGLLSGTLTSPTGVPFPTNVMPDLLDELGNTLNQPLLNAALTDLTGAGVLAAPQAPGAGVIWPQIPPAIFAPGPASSATINGTLAGIIGGM